MCPFPNIHYTPAIQMWDLGRLLPVMVGQWVPVGDEHWQTFLLLLDIVDILLAPEISPEDVSRPHKFIIFQEAVLTSWELHQHLSHFGYAS